MSSPKQLLLRWPAFEKIAALILQHADAAIYGGLNLQTDTPVPRGETVRFTKTWAVVGEAEFKRRAIGELSALVDELWEALNERRLPK